MKLGKRYIAIVEHPGGDPFADDRLCKSEFAAAGVWHSYTNPPARHVDTIEVDLDDAKRSSESPQEAYERNERIGSEAWAEVERLKPIVSRPVGEEAKERPDERRQMRAVIEAMRPIVDAALRWGDSTNAGIDDTDIELGAVLQDNRDRLGLAMSAWSNSQTISEEERMREAAAAWLDSPSRGAALDSIDGRLAVALRAWLGRSGAAKSEADDSGVSWDRGTL